MIERISDFALGDDDILSIGLVSEGGRVETYQFSLIVNDDGWDLDPEKARRIAHALIFWADVAEEEAAVAIELVKP
jgi:hypothetical protein